MGNYSRTPYAKDSKIPYTKDSIIPYAKYSRTNTFSCDILEFLKKQRVQAIKAWGIQRTKAKNSFSYFIDSVRDKQKSLIP